MDFKAESYNTSPEALIQVEEEESPMKEHVKRGPWTVDEDLLLMNYIANHGEGRWNSLARSAGLKRTGKSCRLRWLNYLHPDVRRGNITLEEQLTILQLHSQWGNRWSKIAQHLPGRTDNEIKNYWRTRVQKQAKQLGCSVNSQQFRDTMRYVWMPRLMERIQATSSTPTSMTRNNNSNNSNSASDKKTYAPPEYSIPKITAGSGCTNNNPSYISDNNSMAISSDGQQSPISGLQEYSAPPLQFQLDNSYNLSSLTGHANFSECLPSPNGYYNPNGMEYESSFEQNMWLGNEHFWDNLWDVDQDIWLPK